MDFDTIVKYSPDLLTDMLIFSLLSDSFSASKRLAFL